MEGGREGGRKEGGRDGGRGEGGREGGWREKKIGFVGAKISSSTDLRFVITTMCISKMPGHYSLETLFLLFCFYRG